MGFSNSIYDTPVVMMRIDDRSIVRKGDVYEIVERDGTVLKRYLDWEAARNYLFGIGGLEESC